MMIIKKIFDDKIGPSPITHVDAEFDAAALPIFPTVCPCCMERTDDGAFIEAAAADGATALKFPSCTVCAKHSGITRKISDALGIILLILTVATVFGFLAWRASSFVTELGGAGLEWVGIFKAVKWPFSGMIPALITFVAGMAVFIVYALLLRVLMIPIDYALCKRSCKWFDSHVRISNLIENGQKFTRFTFENPEYAKEFAKANGFGHNG